ncbi:MAG: hypothetical protein KF715_10045 [Candidatus Didemnitutus sp.]|nr:hypothetical protein [Candidatus Didemnitutus sp.]
MQIFELQPLFRDVQLAGVFDDDKVFVDSVPRRSLEEIGADYAVLARTGLDRARLKEFVAANFRVPAPAPAAAPASGAERADVCARIRALWSLLRRAGDVPEADSTLLPLPEPYVVPGGRFREIYYWDSYFTMLGLREDAPGEALIRHMVANFVHLVARHGHVPNGNRSYYLSRSQPPLLAMMVELVTAGQPPAALVPYRAALAAEHDYWMDRAAPTRHVVELPDGAVLNRYWDQLETPRPEAFRRDEALAARANRPRGELFRDLRSAAESGWDFSSRWLATGGGLETIRTTEIVPVDLNCFLWQLESMLARAHAAAGDREGHRRLEGAAQQRHRAILRHCWSAEAEFFCDYDLATGRPGECLSLAGVLPLFCGLASVGQAEAAARRLRADFLRAGGLVTTLRHTGEQWDSPNGWAPLQWLAVRGLERHGHTELAAEVARRWIDVNVATFRRTGLLLEKYDVVEPERPPAGGEYVSQHGFGWTNGVLLDLWRDYPPA